MYFMNMFAKEKVIRLLFGGLLLLLFFLPWRELVIKNKADKPQAIVYSGWDEATPEWIDGDWFGSHFPANHSSYILLVWLSLVFLVIGTTQNWYVSKKIVYIEIVICLLLIWLLAQNGPRDLVIFKNLSGLVSHRLLVPFWLTLVVLVTVLANDIATLLKMKYFKKNMRQSIPEE